MRLDPACQRGDIIIGWLTRVVSILALLGICGYDAISLAVAKTRVTDHASSAALEAAATWARSHDARQAYAAAEIVAQHNSDTVVPNSLVISPEGTVRLELCTTAVTLLLHRTDTTKKWTQQCGSGQGRSVDQ